MELDTGRNPWGSLKTQRTMSMTVNAWDLLGKLAETANISRSEVLEVMIRAGMNESFDASAVRHDLLQDLHKKVALST